MNVEYLGKGQDFSIKMVLVFICSLISIDH